MSLTTRRLLPVLLIAASLLLAGCESAENKAERYYQSALTLLAEGDETRALLELRNVFKYNGFHKEARKTYADLQLKRGEVGEAYSQYLRLIEQYPDTVDVRRTLAEIAISRGDWAEVERHGRAALLLTPDDPATQAIGTALEYRNALMAKDAPAQAAAVAKARALLAGLPGNQVARRIVIDSLLQSPAPQDALPEVELALVAEPGSLEFNVLKLRLLVQINDSEAIGTQLKAMFALFPDNQDIRSALIGWYLARQDIDGAEAFLRQLAGDDSAAPEGHVAVVQLLQQARGTEAARAELDRLIGATAGTPNADLYRALRASIDFDAGRQAEAIAAFEAILKTAEASDQTRRIKGMLARMLASTGNEVGARARVEEVLAEDPSNVEALQMRAAWLTAEDKPGEAIIDLRTALDQSPRDATTLTLMAQAYERDGNLDLAGERLALAVEVSGSAPTESLRYAQFLLRQGRIQPAESILIDARKANPQDVGVLTQLASLWLRAQDWPQVQGVVDALRSLKTESGDRAAQPLQAALLLGQNRTEDSLAFLQSAAAGGNADAVTLIVQTLINSGKPGEARVYLDGELAKTPKDPGLRLLSASVNALAGQSAAAEAGYRQIIAETPGAETPVRLLYGLLQSMNRKADATAVLDAALTAQPGSVTLRLIKAGEQERDGDFEAAIAIYDALYAEDSSNVVVANNLASLISAQRDDAASLERAFAIARRLRGSDQPAFQDTYGWIEYRRGNLPEALVELEPAAAGLPDDPLTQFHLGMTYAGLGRNAEAATVLKRALDLAGDSALPQYALARATLAKLAPAPAETPAEASAEASGKSPGTTADPGPAPAPAPAPAP